MQGNSIHGSIRRTLIYKFQNDILEDNVILYKILVLHLMVAPIEQPSMLTKSISSLEQRLLVLIASWFLPEVCITHLSPY